MTNSDSFKILEINKQNALSKDLVELSRLIKKQRDELARKYHSDKNKDKSDEQMKKLNVAKDKLDELIKKAKETGNKNATSSPGSSSSRHNSYTYSSSGSKGFSSSFTGDNFKQSSYTFCSAGSSNANHSSKDYMEENRDKISVNNCRIGKNYGKININRGEIDSNYGWINTNDGEIDSNYGEINVNISKIGKNFDKINVNHGEIDDNYGSVYINRGTIKRDHSKEKSKPNHGASRGAKIVIDGNGVFVNGERMQPGTAFSNASGTFVSQSRKR